MPDADGPGAEFGLIQMAEEFTALRHELKLQTKSGRGLLEQAEAMVSAIRQAIEQFRSVEPKEAQAAWAVGQTAGRGPGRSPRGPRSRPAARSRRPAAASSRRPPRP